MKKTLAAVLAAAMALSTATVALAVDHPDLGWAYEGAKGDDPYAEILYGKDIERTLQQVGPFDESELGYLYDNGYIDIKAIMVEGGSSLSGSPKFSVKNVTEEGTQKRTSKTIWTTNIVVQDKDGNNRTLCKKGTEVKKIPVYVDPTAGNLILAIYGTPKYEDIKWIEKDGDFAADYAFFLNDTNAISKDVVEFDRYSGDRYSVVRMSFKVTDTYKTGTTNVKLKIRVTIKKNVEDADGTVIYKKGDTYTTDVISFKAKYNEVLDYSEDMQVTLSEVDSRNVILKGSKVYDEVGNDRFTVSFGDDVAMFIGKGSSSQKDVNLFYNLDEDAELTAMYPDIDFEFIEFKGTPSFVNSGSLVFKAENKNYTVYEWDGEGWTPLDGRSTFDPTYKTVTVKNVKKLTKYAVASDVLPVEDEEPEEPAEPVDSTPVAEPDDDEGQNPNTGAC